jgi:hypothetical protein
MRWKWIFGVVALLIIGVIVAVFVVLSSYDFNNLKPQITKACMEATGRELTMGGDIDLDIGFTPALVVEDISFQNAPWGSRPVMGKLRRFEVRVALLPLISGNIEVRRLILVEPDILIETDRAGKSNLEFKPPKKPKIPEPKEGKVAEGKIELPALTLNDIRIVKGRLTYKDGQSSSAYTVSIENLKSYATGPESPIKLDLKGACNGKTFEVASVLGALPALTDPDIPWPLNLTARVVDIILTVDGTIKDPLAQSGFKLNFNVKGKDLESVEQLTGKLLPITGPFEVSGSMTDPEPETYKISDFKVMLGENSLSGSVEINLAGDIPKLAAVFSSKKLDLRSFLQEGANKAKGKIDKTKPKQGAKGEIGKTTPKRDKVFPDERLETDALKQINADIKIRISKMALPRLALDDLSVEAILNNGLLEVKPLKAVVGGGALDGRFDLRPRGKEVALTTAIKIDQLDLGLMLKEFDVSDILDGNIDANINLKSRGQSVATLMGRLDGDIIVVMDNGRIQNKHIDLLGGDLSSGLFRLLNPSKEKADFTDINCFVSRFDIKGGLAESTVLVLDTDLMSVVGEGDIDLKTEKLNFSLKPLPKKGIGNLSLSLGELTEPFKLGGTLAKPTLVIDPTQTAIAIGKAVGGVALFGPAGIAADLVGGKSDDENLCLTAIEAAKKGVKISEVKGPDEKKGVVKKPAEGVKEDFDDIGNKLKDLFRN